MAQILKRAHREALTAVDVQQMIVADHVGDLSKAEESLDALLLPMKHILAVSALIANIREVSENYAKALRDMAELDTELAEKKAMVQQEAAALDNDLAAKKAATALAEKNSESAVAKRIQVERELALLEVQKAALTDSLEDDKAAKSRLEKAIDAEYRELRQRMLAQVETEREVARTEATKALTDTKKQIAEAQEKLDAIKSSISQILKVGGV